jgi:hypothetical protein
VRAPLMCISPPHPKKQTKRCASSQYNSEAQFLTDIWHCRGLSIVWWLLCYLRVVKNTNQALPGMRSQLAPCLLLLVVQTAKAEPFDWNKHPNGAAAADAPHVAVHTLSDDGAPQ